MGPEGQTSLFAPEPAPDPLLCWLWLAHVMGPASSHAGRMLDAFEDRFGALACRELKAAAKSSPCAGEKDCSRYVRAAAQIVGDVLSKEEA